MSENYIHFKEQDDDFARCDRCLKPTNFRHLSVVSFKEHHGFARQLEICPICANEIKKVIFTKKQVIEGGKNGQSD